MLLESHEVKQSHLLAQKQQICQKHWRQGKTMERHETCCFPVTGVIQRLNRLLVTILERSVGPWCFMNGREESKGNWVGTTTSSSGSKWWRWSLQDCLVLFFFPCQTIAEPWQSLFYSHFQLIHNFSGIKCKVTADATCFHDWTMFSPCLLRASIVVSFYARYRHPHYWQIPRVLFKWLFMPERLASLSLLPFATNVSDLVLQVVLFVKYAEVFPP